MLKIYGSKEAEAQLLEILAEYRVTTFLTYAVKGRTRKVRSGRGKGYYKVVNYPI